MNRLFLEILPFGVALQIVCYLLWAFNVFGGLIQYPLGDPTSVTDAFAVDAFGFIVGTTGAAIIGLASLLLRQGTYAIYAMLLWGIGTVFKGIRQFFLAIPNTIGALVPSSTNPFPVDPVTGIQPTNPYAVIITVIVGYAAFWWLFSLVVQRDT